MTVIPDTTALATHAARLAGVRLVDLFERDSTRFGRFSRRLGPLLVDVSKQAVDVDAWQALLGYAEAVGLPARRDALFAGEPVNRSEQRPALHMALRAPDDMTGSPAWQTARRDVKDCLAQMTALVDAVRKAPAYMGLPSITDVVSIGIGGSDFGPRLACAALASSAAGGPRVHFLANVDGGRTANLMRQLDPRHTLVLLISKSFGTQETLLNGRVLFDWLVGELGAEQAHRRLFAVTANAEAARTTFDLDDARILPMWDFVGGRYSLWSAVGLPVALAIGMDAFRQLLAGAHAVDKHFLEAPLADNLPVWLALVSWWNRVWLGRGSHCIVPYDDRLDGLPGYLQQLEMESNGKRVREDGRPVDLPTAPVVWGSVGSNAQHAYFQALHQGTDVIPVDFIGVVEPGHELDDNHRALLANLLGQGAALMRGRDGAAARAAMTQLDPAQRDSLAAQKTFPGNRPSTTVLLDRLDPQSLGALLALYEHKTFVYATLCGINPFDQWGVELGKTLAARIEPGLRGETAVVPDPSTAGLLAHIRALRKARGL